MQIVDINSEYYPDTLRDIEDPPRKLYVLGDVLLLSEKSIAIVGSRKCTEYGRKQGTKFAYNLSKEGFVIISGMAIGIDSSAHIGALEAGEKTIAVLGSGFNNIYPPENKKLFERILNNKGAIITEYQPNIERAPDNFRKRNRIISGLSMGVLVIEAAQKSGTGITVGYARRQKKPVFCIPNSLENKKGEGTNRLLKRDAILATDVNDILEYYNMKKIKQISFDEIEKRIEIPVKPEYAKVYKIIEKGPIHINQISKETGMSIGELNSLLLMMELEGLISNKSGNNYEVIM